jgi:demethylmenaquinone methyltransferase/2-methoxy-6-polyprenyl-1,4-benzoquinol methylase
MSKSETVTPYSSADSKKEQVTSMFDNIAPYYDILNLVLSLGIDTIWRRNAIKTLKAKDPKLMLDIATGTADLAIEANKQLNLDKIIGLDISKEMISVGNEKLKKKKLSDKIELVVGDSEALGYDDNHFDALTVAFGVRNFGNLKKGLGEMYRVLKKDGKVVILEFSKPTIFPFKQLFNGYFKYVLPVIGRVKSKDPKAYTYLYESVQAFPDYERLDAILQEIGFKHTEWKSQTLGICTIYTGVK